jgi:LysM repeat protein
MEIYIPQVPNAADSNQGNENGYTVQPGDTLESIASQFGIELEALIAANFIDGQIGELSPGQELNIPTSENVTGFISYISQQGDTKDTVASQFNLGVTDLFRANPSLVNNPLIAGTPLKIPQLVQDGGEQSKLPEDYTMKLGDTLGEIAKKYGISAEDLQKANPDITDVNKMYPGKTIKFPQNKPIQENNNQTKEYTPPTLSAMAFDNFSKVRFQMMGNLQQVTPSFGTPQQEINNREEGAEEDSKQKRKPSIPAPFDKWAEFIHSAAEKYNLEASLIASVIWYESGGNNIVGKNGHAFGLMQIDARRYPDWIKANSQGLEPSSNIDFGASILRNCLNRFQNDRQLALAAYSLGIEAIEYSVSSNLPNNAGIRYAFEILSHQEYFKKFFEDF